MRTRITEASTHVCFLLEAIEQEGVRAPGQAAEEHCAPHDADRVEVTELPEVPRGE